MPADNEGSSTTSEPSHSAANSDALWQRWCPITGPFYQSCAVAGFDAVSDTKLNTRQGTEKPTLQFCSGLLRLGLRNTPILILIGASLSFALNQLNDFYLPFGTYLPVNIVSPTVEPLYLLGLPFVILWGVLLVRIFRTSISTDEFQIHRTIVFYGTALLLLAGVGVAIYLVLTNKVTGTRQHISFRAGYFLFIFLEGHLAYDGLALRGENLLWNLKQSEIVDKDQYDQFRTQLTQSLAPIELGPVSVPVGGSETTTLGPLRVTPGLLFAVVLLVPFIPLPILAYQTSHPLIGRLAYSITVVFQIFLIGVLFQFVVLVWQFSTLLSGDYLDYKPFHPDEHGGYRALGRFATRVNIMLVVAGGYVSYRFVTGGLPQFRAISGESFVELLTWGISFVAPFLVYLAVVILWLYFSFWRMHRQMQRGRREKIQILQQRARDAVDEDEERAETQMEDLNLDAPAWESLRNAPVWPIKRRSLLGIAVLDTLPVLATFII